MLNNGKIKTNWFPKKIIFLDIDGVLNSKDWYFCRKGKKGKGNIDPAAVRNLKSIIKKTDASIVLSSSWRTMSDIFEQFRNFGQGLELYAILNPLKNKGEALDEWMETYGKLNFSYIIIDDDNEYGDKYDDALFQTDYEHGLVKRHIEKIVEELNNG